MRTCRRCPTVVKGRDVLCGRCRDADGLCRECGRAPVSGPTSLYCAPCRSLRRTRIHGVAFTPEQDDAIRAVYAEHHNRKALVVLAQRLGKSRAAIQKRAQRIGCATLRVKEPAWTATELGILECWAWMTPDRVRAKLVEHGFRRSTTAVAIQLKKRRLRGTTEGTSANALAEVIGHAPATVARWITQGKLKAEKRGDGVRDAYYVTDEAFRRFVLAHYDLVDLGKVERAGSKHWFLDLIAKGKLSA